MHYDAVIVGAGPGGLACGARLAANGLKTLIIERKPTIGQKSCAGGITWGGLIGQTPAELIERSFSHQTVKSRFQNICVVEKKPIIATVNREKFGEHLAAISQKYGAQIRTSVSVDKLSGTSIQLKNRLTKELSTVTYSFLIGADGSTSKVRKYLGIPAKNIGIGINYQLAGNYEKMEWHLDSRFFGNGYGWIFPHRNTISIGAYTPQPESTARELKNQLVRWAEPLGFRLEDKRCTAGLINYDYRGHVFGNVFLVGDAAGLASALTGEGIYPAILSGEAVAEMIVANSKTSATMTKLIEKQQRFAKMVNITGKNDFISTVLAEIGVFGLRLKLINFNMLEMGNTKKPMS